jgi:acetolactate synthase I/II/III large subunit
VIFGTHTTAVDFCPVDHAAIANACGCRGLRVESVKDLEAALDVAASGSKPTLIDVVTDPNAYPPITSSETVGEQA